MRIGGSKIKLYYWEHRRSSHSGYCIFPEIKKGEYYYELEAGQKIFAIRYDGSNREQYFNAVIEKVDEAGIYLSKHMLGDSVFVPWKKELPNYKNEPELYALYIEPCECLYEYNKLEDVLTGNIAKETYINNRLIEDSGSGIWYKHGGWRSWSEFECNLKKFKKWNEQISLFDIQTNS